MSSSSLTRELNSGRRMTRTGAVATALAGVCLILGLSAAYDHFSARNAPPPPVPECFDADHPVTGAPATSALKAGEHILGPWLLREKSAEPLLSDLAEAQKQCLPQACGAEAHQKYIAAMSVYLGERTRKIKAMQNLAGAAGLADAINFYRRPIDREIDQGLRERYNARLVDLSARSWTQMGEAVPMIIFRGGDALKACGRID